MGGKNDIVLPTSYIIITHQPELTLFWENCSNIPPFLHLSVLALRLAISYEVHKTSVPILGSCLEE